MFIKLPAPPVGAMKVFSMLTDFGFEPYFVGGCVRDRILGRDVNDWDIATNATPDQVVSLFDHVVETGIQHGTVTVVEDGEHYEVTTYRVDGAYTDGRRPDTVTFTPNILDDLARRDFTINAMAWDPLQEVLIDPFGGQLDILQRSIKAVGDPYKRFAEDGLRSIRAVRFASVLNFVIESKTVIAILESKETFKLVSKERIRDELVKILRSPYPQKEFRLLLDLGFLDLFSELEDRVKASGRALGEHHFFNCRRLPVQLATLAVKYCHVRAEVFMKLLKFPLDITSRVVRIANTSDLDVLCEKDSDVRRLLSQVGRDIFADVFEYQHQINCNYRWLGVAQRVIELNAVADPLTIRELAVNGHDLIALGLKSGIEVGSALKYLLEKVWEDPSLNTKTQLLKLLPLPEEV